VNPGGTASYGAVIFDGGKRIWECSRVFHPVKGRERETSNNVAEYAGFLALLDYFIEQKLTDEHIVIHGDSNLVIEQCFGRWKIRAGFYVPLAREAKLKAARFSRLRGRWIPRAQNGIADELSKAELVKAGVEFRIQPLEPA
jgi:probable phosphoglycerate mutase